MTSNPESKFQTLQEIVEAAHMNLSKGPWEFVVGGSETETSVKRNRQALDTIALEPRVLVDVFNVDSTSDLFGKKMRLPVVLAPVGSMYYFAEEGAATAAKAAGEFGIAQFLSSSGNHSIEEVAAAADHLRIFQLYLRGDDAWVDEHVRRALDNGYTGFCFTVDTAVPSRRERDILKRWVRPTRTGAIGREFATRFTWDNIKRFKDAHDIPLILKGVSNTADAAKACELGVDVVYVSNHGGRQLDHCRGSVDVLPEIVSAVAGRAAIIVDGGCMRGSDVVKAIALGAQAVGIGRLQCLGLAAAGQEGLVRTLELLEEEIQICLGLLGVDSLKALNDSYLHAAAPVDKAHVLSAFPLMDLRD